MNHTSKIRILRGITIHYRGILFLSRFIYLSFLLKQPACRARTIRRILINEGGKQMSIVKRNNELRPLYSTLLDEFLNTGLWPLQMNQGQNVPALNVREDDESLTLDIRVPGMKKENIKLDYNDGFLTISGESHEEKEEEEGKGKSKYLRREFSSYSFRRTIELPEEKYDVAEAQASYEDGILKVSMPKNKEVRKLQKTIEVK